MNSGMSKIDLTKGIGKDLTKLLSKFASESSKMAQLIPNNLLNIDDSGEFEKTGKNIIKIFKDIQRIANDFNGKELVDAKKLFPDAFDKRVSDLYKRMEDIGNSFARVAQKEAELVKSNNNIKGLTDKLNELKTAASNLDALEQNATQTSAALNAANQAVNDLRNSLTKEISAKVDTDALEAAKKEAKALGQQLQELQTKGVTTGKKGNAVFQGKGLGEWTPAEDASNEEKARASEVKKMLRDYNEINKLLKEQRKIIEDIEALQKIQNEDKDLTKKKSIEAASKVLGKSQVAKDVFSNVKEAESKKAQAQVDLGIAQGASDKIKEISKQLVEENRRVEELEASIKALKAVSDFSQVSKALEAVGIKDVTQDMFSSADGIEHLKKQLAEIDEEAFTKLKEELRELGIVLPQAGQAAEVFSDGIRQSGQAVEELTERERELKNFKDQLLSFFSISNAVDIFKRAINSAMQTVKELDATMTEAAVVTDYSVGDMWDKLPEYSKQAQQLGVSINGMYQATTLYYQQGLKNNEAMALGVETMKMAKIASMDSADATTAMTAALRGFNMELNETSAVRVNDVYSQLAAVTAADTNQIATAMSKTASIAASANMEFETTAALLAQIIETTQEAPETAGTALKTIIARFSEVKSLKERGLVTGQDLEGEELDVNKIQTALRSVGISMDGFFAGTEGLDDVLLRLAEKWDTLDFTTQRYIATTAAGSRQQSRFIAMMSDYKRTTELVGEANNSAGASQEQFNKTLDSMESKLQRLDNAWDQFLMGLTNNEILKFGVDFLTTVIEGLNNVTSAISGSNGLIKSVVSLGTVLGGLKLGKSILGGNVGGNLLSNLIGKEVEKQGQEMGKEAGTGLVAGLKNMLFGGANKSTNSVQSQKKSHDKKIDYLAQAYELNQENMESAMDLNVAEEAFDGVIAKGGSLKKAAKAANAELKKMGLTAVELGKDFEEPIAGTKKLSFNMGSLSTAIIGAGAAAGMLSGLFSSLGMDEAAETTAKISQYVSLIGVGLKTIPGAIAKIKQMEPEKLLTSIRTAGYVAAAALVVAGVVSIVKAWKDAEGANDKAIGSMSKAANEFADQVKEAKEELNQLADKHKELDNLQKSLKDLTKGTTEWKQKLIEVNTTVLDLIDKYPELMGYVSRGTEGQLVIDDAGWDAAAKGAEQRYQTAAMGQLNANLRKTEYQEQKALEEAQSDAVQGRYLNEELFSSKGFKDGAKMVGTGVGLAGGMAVGAMLGTAAFPIVGTIVGGVLGAIAGLATGSFIGNAHDLASGTEDQITRETTGLGKDDYMAFAAAASEKGLTNAAGTSKAEFKQLFDEMGLQGSFETLYSNIQSLGAEFDELGVQALSLETAQKTYVDSIVSQVAEFNKATANSRYREQAESVVSNNNENLSNQINKEAERLMASRNYVDKNGEATDTLIGEYAEISGKTSDEVRAMIADSSLSVETMVTAVAGENVNDQLANELKEMTKVIEKIGKTSEPLLRALSKEGHDIRQGDLSAFMEAADGDFDTNDEQRQKEIITTYLQREKLTESQIHDIFKTDAWKTIWEGFHKSYDSQEDIADLLKSISISNEKITDSRISYGAAEDLVTMIKKQVLQGATGAEGILTYITNLSQGFTDVADAEKFTEILTSINLDDISSVEGLDEALLELFGDTDDGRKKIRQLQDALISFANSSGEVTQEIYRKNVTDRNKLIKEMNYGNKKLFTEEEKNLFTDRVKGNFVWTPEGYVYEGKESNQELVNDLLHASGIDSGVNRIRTAIDWSSKADQVSVDSLRSTAGLHLNGKLQGYDSLKDQAEKSFNVDWSKGTESTNIQRLQAFYSAFWEGNIGDGGQLKNLIDLPTLQQYYSSLDEESQKYVMAMALGSTDRNASGSGYRIMTTSFNQMTSGLTDDLLQTALESEEGYTYNGLEELFGKISSKTLKVQGIDTIYGSDEYVSEDTIRSLYEFFNPEGKLTNIQEIIDYFNNEVIPSLPTEKNLYDYYMGQTADTIYSGMKYGRSEEEKNAAAKALSARIESLNLGNVVENWQEQFKGPETVLQLLASYAYDSANAVKYLGETLKNNKEAFVKGEKAGIAYYQALENITSAAQGVFGQNISEDFIEQNKDLFLQMLSGVDVEKAMSEIGKKYVQQLGVNEYIAQALSNELAEQGSFFDASTLVDQLRSFGIGQTLIKQMFQAFGYDLAIDGQKAAATKTDVGGILGEFGFDSDWENPYDKFYNSVKQINAELRIREKLEREYQRLLERNAASPEELIEGRKAQIDSLKEEKRLREELLKNRQKQMVELESENSGLKKYAWYDEKFGVQINWEEIEALKSSTDDNLKEEVTQYISNLEKQEELIKEEQDALENIEDTTWEIYRQGQDEYFDLEDRIKNAIVESRQEEIDKLVAINDSINDSNSKIIASLQETIAQQRQDRENQRTETELEDKRRRLAFLQMDTSGANALDILKLQEEITQGEQDYTDSLVDQKISELQKQNDKAAEQRQMQIDIMQQQLDQYVETGGVWKDVNELLKGGVDEKGIINGSDLQKILKDSANFAGLSTLGQMQWLNELEGLVATAVSWLGGGALQLLYGQGKKVTFTNASGEEITGTIDENGNIIVGNSLYEGKNFVVSSDGKVFSTQTKKQAQESYRKAQRQETENEVPNEDAVESGKSWTFKETGKEYTTYFAARQAIMEWYDEAFGQFTKEYNSQKNADYDDKSFQEYWNKKGEEIYLKQQEYLSQIIFLPFKTGGLASFTGPAWLDGTKSNPEYVLNAQQTKAFLSLVDILEHFNGSGRTSSENYGDNIIDVDINIETVKEEADIDMLAEKLQRAIVTSAQYRNNTFIKR